MKNYLQFSSLAFQMGLIIAVFFFIGKYLDAYFGNQKLIFTAALSVVGVVGSFIKLWYDLKKLEK